MPSPKTLQFSSLIQPVIVVIRNLYEYFCGACQRLVKGGFLTPSRLELQSVLAHTLFERLLKDISHDFLQLHIICLVPREISSSIYSSF